MAKQIVILNQVPGAGVVFQYVLWAAVPAARQPFYANANAVSAWSGASSAENGAIAAGQVAELVQTQGWPSGTSLAIIQAALIASWTAWQNQVNGLNNWSRYGTFYDGTSWTAGGVS